MTEQLVYLYCVTEKEPKPRDGVGHSSDVYFIRHKALFAVVCKVAPEEFDEQALEDNVADVEWIITHATRHETVIEQIMADVDVIPFKLGTLFNTEDSLREMLEEHQEAFTVILTRLDSKQEWGVKIYCDMKTFHQRVVHGHAELLGLEKEIGSASVGRAYFLQKKLDERTRCLLDSGIDELCRGSFELLSVLSDEAHVGRLQPKDVTKDRDAMILNSAFLVGKDKMDSFMDAVNTLRTRHESKGLRMDCTGPWPPYNFCQLPMEIAHYG